MTRFSDRIFWSASHAPGGTTAGENVVVRDAELDAAGYNSFSRVFHATGGGATGNDFFLKCATLDLIPIHH